MKPIHCAVIAAVLAAAGLLMFALDSDSSGRTGRREHTTDLPGERRDGRDESTGRTMETHRAGDGALSITLQLVAHQEPAAGARVTLFGRAAAAGTADEQGVLEIHGLKAGLYSLKARKGDAVGAMRFELKAIADLGTLELTQGATIRGHVFSETGAPFPGALVEAVTEVKPKNRQDMLARFLGMMRPDMVAGRAVAGPDGAYELRVASGHKYSMRATAAGYGLESERTRPVVADLSGIDFHLLPGANIHGRVINTAGAPISGAHVIILNMDAMMTNRKLKAEAVTDARGEFRAPLLTSEVPMLIVRATGYATFVDTGVDRSVTIVLERGITLRLRVIDEIKKEPAPGVRILAIYNASFAEGVTGADGRLEIENLAETASETMGERQIWLHGGAYVPKVVDIEDRQPVDGVLDVGDLEVSRGMTVRGRVLEEATRHPIEGALVRALPGEDAEMMMMSSASVKTGPDGSFELGGVPAQTQGLVAIHPDYALPESLESLLTRESDSIGRDAEHEILLAPAARIAGVVKDPDGTPVAGAQLFARNEEIMMATMMGLGPEQPVSDANGYFEFTGLREGTELKILAVHRDYSPATPTKAVAGKGGRITIALSHPVQLTGRIVDSAGNPIAGARVSVEIQDGEEEEMSMFLPDIGGTRPTMSNDQGVFRLRHVPPGKLKLTADHSDFKITTKPITVAPGAPERKAGDITLLAGAEISGVVIDGAGQPLSRIQVTAIGSQRDGDSGRSQASIHTDKQGEFHLRGLAPGRFGIEAHALDWYTPLVRNVTTGTKGVRIVLRRPARLTGRVIGNRGPVRGATVNAVRKGSSPDGSASVTAATAPGVVIDAEKLWDNRDILDTATTGADGEFILKHLPPAGTFAIQVTHEGFKPFVRKEILATQPPLQIMLDPGVQIGGAVYDNLNRPIRRARIQIRVNNKSAKDVYSDGKGRFTAGGLDDGPITVRVRESGIGLIKGEWVEVRPGDRNLRLVARRGETISGRLRNADGRPGKEVEVAALNEDGKEVASDWIWRDNGRFELKGLRPGTYRLRIRSWNDRNNDTAQFVEAIRAGTRDLEITLK